jgi:hypothetical protein
MGKRGFGRLNFGPAPTTKFQILKGNFMFHDTNSAALSAVACALALAAVIAFAPPF